ncbi:DivIVA domain-containing protein [Kribbella catacumbae]|uniref:DivIVA domain-containing protein n=1 Tax=Kribbella catacumbae TaxID=460086 RepID=UPI00035CCA1B|nr:DivIVA domain-containing protein [Kribbella catacumbae]
MWFFGLIVVLLIGAVAVVASGRWGAMAPAYDDRPDLTVPARQALTADELERARFGVGLRGYRMDEVDTLLERVAREVAERDRRIADLERAVSPIIHGPEGAGFTSRSEYTTADFDDTGYTKPILVGGDFPPGQAELAAPTAPEAPAQPEAQVGSQPEADLQGEQVAQPEVVTPSEESDAADGVQGEGWFEEEAAPSPLHDQPQPPVPLPPLLQELVHTHEEDEPEPTPWFQAKEPPPDHTAADPTPGTPDAPGSPEDEGDPGDADDGQPRGRHSAAPDVSAVQRPN